jgi:delta 1-pyrroline-5-carboxylate dehydrogenase
VGAAGLFAAAPISFALACFTGTIGKIPAICATGSEILAKAAQKIAGLEVFG